MALDSLRATHREILVEVARIRVGSAELTGLSSLVLAHLEIEERELVPMLEPFLPSDSGPLPAVLEDHARIRTLLGAGVADLDRIEDLLRTHFAKEEELLYPFAESRLRAGELDRFEESER